MKKLICLMMLLCLLLLTACGGETVPLGPEDSDPRIETPAEPAPPEEPPLSVEEALLKEMTLEEKVGQLFFGQVPVENALEDISAYHLGGYILFGQDTQNKTANDLIQTIAAWQEASKVPLLIGVDEEGGTVVRVSSNPKLRAQKFPNPKTLWDQGVEAIAADAHEKDLLLRALGFNVNLAPVADVSTSTGDFIYDRTTGGDVEAAKTYVSTVVEVMCRDGMGSVLKHFPGYGSNQDTHKGTAVDKREMSAFWDSDFQPFQAGVETGGDMTAILVSHNIVNCMDPDYPASLSYTVHEILREDLDYEGLIMTDDLSMKALKEYAGAGKVAVMAIRAGNDLLVSLDYRTQIPQVLEAVENGELNEDMIDAACLRVLRWKAALGLLNPAE